MFKINKEKILDGLKVKMSGVIDEDAKLSEFSISGESKIEIDLNGVKSINSCGIREWLKWIGTAGSAQIKLFQCPKVIIDQINMVQGFLPINGKVLSFYVPYYSEESSEEKNILLSFGKDYTDTEIKPPSSVLDEKGNVMEIDVVESKYFKFLKGK
jgi:anti-anti-sigma regulatory factor